MPRVEILSNFHMGIEKGAEPDGDGMVEIWTLVLTDKGTLDQIRISFRRDSRDELIRQLTDGIVLAGGELPKV